MRALQGVVVGTVISLAVFVAAVRLTRLRAVTDEEGGGLFLGFLTIVAAGAMLGGATGVVVGSRSAE